MADIKLKPERMLPLLDSGVNRIENDPREIVRKSRSTRARSLELIDKSRRLIDSMRQRRDKAE